MNTFRTCPSCGKSIDAGFAFCPACGKGIDTAIKESGQTTQNQLSGGFSSRRTFSPAKHPWLTLVGVLAIGIGIYGIATTRNNRPSAQNASSASSSSSSSQSGSSPRFELADISTGFIVSGTGAWTMYMPSIEFTVVNTGTVDISSITLTGRFYSEEGGSIIGSDVSTTASNIPAGSSRGSYRLSCTNGWTVNDGNWDDHLAYMRSHRYSPHTVQVFTRCNGGAETLYDEFDIYIP